MNAGMRPDHAVQLKRLRRLANLLDECIRIPGTRIRFGLDGILGLVPVAGDVITTLISLHIIRQAMRMGVPREVLLRMLLNLGGDFLMGAVPVVGDLADLAWKANTKNLNLLEAWLKELDQPERQPVIDV